MWAFLPQQVHTCPPSVEEEVVTEELHGQKGESDQDQAPRPRSGQAS